MLPSLRDITGVEGAMDEDSFVYMVSHDIRSAARALAEVPDWIKEDLTETGQDLPEDVVENIDLLRSNARKLDRMMTDLLTLFRVGRIGKPEDVDVQDIITIAIEGLELPEHFSVDFDNVAGTVRLPPQEAILMAQILIDNAARHGNPDNGNLCVTSASEPGRLCLVFKDDGPGVPEAALERIFLPMESCHRKDELEGSCLGLAILKKIVLSNGGRLRAGNDPETGGLRVEIRLTTPLQQDLDQNTG